LLVEADLFDGNREIRRYLIGSINTTPEALHRPQEEGNGDELARRPSNYKENLAVRLPLPNLHQIAI
jgi:hypothetical protein